MALPAIVRGGDVNAARRAGESSPGVSHYLIRFQAAYA